MKLRINHYPQLQSKPFMIEVNSLEEAYKISNILANYDLFQYENKIKPDYANMTVIEEYDEKEKKWLLWEDKETGISDLNEYFDYIKSKKW